MPSALIPLFQNMARYNRLANEAIYAACAKLSDAERRRDRKAFFSSIHGTLNHIMVGDRIWLARFEGGTAPSTNLGAILYEDFEDLRAARQNEDKRIESLIPGLGDAFFAGEITFVNNEGRSLTHRNNVLLPHFFNHQTHHRGQVHDMLCQTDVAAPILDLHWVLDRDKG